MVARSVLLACLAVTLAIVVGHFFPMGLPVGTFERDGSAPGNHELWAAQHPVETVLSRPKGKSGINSLVLNACFSPLWQILVTASVCPAPRVQIAPLLFDPWPIHSTVVRPTVHGT